MTTETIIGLHTCKPKNSPQIGEVKHFVLENRGNWTKIRNPDKKIETGSPYRILSAEKTDYSDSHGNVSYNLEIEPAVGGGGGERHNPVQAASSPSQNLPVNEPQSPPVSQNGEDGVRVTREHLMRSANLYNLCVDAADKAIAPWMPEVARTSEQFQAIVASLYIEASRRITLDGVNWWSYLDKMPVTPIKKAKPDLPF